MLELFWWDIYRFINIYLLVGGFNLSLWKMMEFVTWDDYSIPNIPNMNAKS